MNVFRHLLESMVLHGKRKYEPLQNILLVCERTKKYIFLVIWPFYRILLSSYISQPTILENKKISSEKLQ